MKRATSNEVLPPREVSRDDELMPPAACDVCRLRATGAFHGANTAEEKFIQSERKRSERFSRGDVIVQEHEQAKFIRTIYSGWAFRFKTLQDGRRQILNFLLPGDLIGLQEQIADAPLHGVEALTPLSTCSFQADTVWRMFNHHASLAFSVTWLAAREESFVDENLLSVGRRSAVERVGALYLHLFRRARRLKLVDQEGWFEWPLTQDHIADALGLSLAHTQRTLRILKRMGLYSQRGAMLRIENPRALERIADYYAQETRLTPLI